MSTNISSKRKTSANQNNNSTNTKQKKLDDINVKNTKNMQQTTHHWK